ncbi:MAG TPA: hypothetical protein VML55_19435 [Planctomycetaceae bacterium]|nr:hypothetical protein [Planctomycetaceae bacterium]
MTATAEVIESNGTQTVRLPAGFRLEATTVSVRRDGEAIVLEPLRPTFWPAGFFDRIRIDDPAFVRPA